MTEQTQGRTPFFNTKQLVLMGVLIALQVVLSRFLAISAWNIKIGFEFVPIMVGGMLLGPLGGGMVGAISDLVGSMLFPSGAFFPGFTLTAFLTGSLFGLFLQKKQNFARLALVVVLNQVVSSLLLNTLWISILYGSSFLALLSTRVMQAIFYIPVQIVIGLILARLPLKKWGNVT